MHLCEHEEVHYNLEHDNFYCSKCKKGMGDKYYKKHKNTESKIQEKYVFETREDLVEWVRGHLSINADTSYDIKDYYGEGQRVEIKVDICEDGQYYNVGNETVDTWVARRNY